jgi:hypothetical protein
MSQHETSNHSRTIQDITLLRFKDIKGAGIFNNRMSLKRAMERDADPFPRPLELGPNSIGWRLSDIKAWLDRRAHTSEGAA